MTYTVAEWIDDTDQAYVIGERLPIDQAYTLLNIAPPHLKRFITDADGRIIRDQREEANG